MDSKAILFISGLASLGLLIFACSAGGGDNPSPSTAGKGGSGTGGSGSGGKIGVGGSTINFDASAGSSGSGFVANPTTCEQSAASHSYIGCDYWPTVTLNPVWSVFDFAVVVANTGTENAEITVTGPNNVNSKETVPPKSLKTIYLPWVKGLKGPDFDVCANSPAGLESSIKESGGAYHLVSTRPVTVYQFNALEYKAGGGPSGKSWSSCPGNQHCAQYNEAVGCFSYSNDASLLLPSTAMTQNYRVIGANGWTYEGTPAYGAFVAITAVQDGTEVQFLSRAKAFAGGGLPALSAGDTGTVTLNAGDVLQILGQPSSSEDFSGSRVVASKPVQVITGSPCRYVPDNNYACDHLEESVFPAETLGKEYVVTVPASPNGAKALGQVVRIVGNVDGTTLTFDPAIKGSTTMKVDAGQVLDLGIQGEDFKVSGSSEFAVATFMLAAELVDPKAEAEQKGDPSQTLIAAVEQYRDSYVFLAPADYDLNFVNIMAPAETSVTVDGKTVESSKFSAVGNSGILVARVQLDSTGTHTLSSNKPVGIQVYGYGSYTTYQYPGGLNLKAIAPPPVK